MITFLTACIAPTFLMRYDYRWVFTFVICKLFMSIIFLDRVMQVDEETDAMNANIQGRCVLIGFILTGIIYIIQKDFSEQVISQYLVERQQA